MITSDLISYIRKQISKNINKDIIISNLISAGWHRDDIDEGFFSIENELKTTNIEKTEKEVSVAREENTEIEIFKPELLKEEVKLEPIIEKENVVIPKVWTPRVVPTIQSEKKDVVVSNPEIKNSVIKIDKIVQNDFKSKEELIPTLTPKKVYNSFDSIAVPKKVVIKNNNINNLNQQKNSFVKNLPQGAMLSSYKSDSLLADKENEVISKPRARRFYKWIIFILIFLFASGIVWYFANGDTNFSLIKKDPKVLLLNNSENLATLQAYKTETNIEISSPSFSNLTYGLVNGEAVPSKDKDTFSIDILGIINKKDNDLVSDTFITAKSSILEDYIVSNIKDNGSELFISASSFNQVLKQENSSIDFIKINEEEMTLVPSLFDYQIESKLNKINLYKILSNGLASYVNNATLKEYNELINNAEIIEKGQENIKGVETYHYSVVVEKQLLKKLFNKIVDNFFIDISKEDRDNLNLIFGSSTINSFDVWIGKGDNNIYQYSIALDIPLSKIIGFEDSSIGDNKINFTWKTTYFDFNKINNISIPESSISMPEFFNSVAEKRIREDAISFEKLAKTLFKKEGTYGKNSNIKGSCMNPVSGSLFSPVGHPKNTNTEISSISILLNKMLGEENNNAYCYSNQKAWSFSVPVLNDYSKETEEIKYNFCVDSTGLQKELINPPTGVVCK